MKDYRKLCIELFGTDDETELRKIAGRLRGGRKKALTENKANSGLFRREPPDNLKVSQQTA